MIHIVVGVLFSYKLSIRTIVVRLLQFHCRTKHPIKRKNPGMDVNTIHMNNVLNIPSDRTSQKLLNTNHSLTKPKIDFICIQVFKIQKTFN